MGPLVTLVTPTLDPGDRLEACLASIGGQTYPHIEHIVIDGGSTDGTLKRLENSGARWVSEPDRGQSDAINKGVRLSSGAFVGWLNADDVLASDAIEVSVHQLLASEAGWSYGDVVLRLGTERFVWAARRKLRWQHTLIGALAPQPGSLVARWAWDRVGSLDESAHLVMDVDLNLRLYDAGIRSVHVDRVLAEVEVHKGSKSGSVPQERWYSELARTMFARSRPTAGLAYLGRVAARLAFDSVGRQTLTSSRLRESVEEAIQGAAPASEIRNQFDHAYAGALIEAAMLARAADERWVSFILRPEPWLGEATRAYLLHMARARLPRKAIGGIPRWPYA